MPMDVDGNEEDAIVRDGEGMDILSVFKRQSDRGMMNQVKDGNAIANAGD